MSVESSVRLRPEEAVPLAHAMMARAGADAGVRVLAIKGPVVAEYGLRRARPSADVDVLVDPARVEDLVGVLVSSGWRRQVEGTYPRILAEHARHVLNDHWPVGIDVHHYFPGFLADPGVVFEALWARHRLVDLAGVPVPACDPVGQVAVVALHLLRDSPRGLSAGLRDLSDRAKAVLSAEGGHDLVRLARETEAIDTLRPFLLSLGVQDRELGPVHASDALATWNRRVRQVRYEVWFVHFRRTPVWRWPREIWHALMLTDEEIRTYSRVPPGEGNLTVLRLRRVKRGVAGIPRTVRALVRERRSARGR